MKNFHQFTEDLRQLEKDLDTLEKSYAPKQRLAARRKHELQKSKTAGVEFNLRSAQETNAQRERMS